MAGTGTKYLVFMVIAHSLLYSVGSAGFIPFQDTANPHNQYVDMFQEGGAAEKSVNVAEDSSGFISTVTSIAISIPIISDLYMIIFGPYALLVNTGLPTILTTLIGGILGAIEFSIMIKVIRGVNF